MRYHVEIQAPANQVTGKLGEAPGDIVPRTDTTCALEMHRDDLPEWVAHRLLELGCDFEVHAPQELSDELQRIADRARRAAHSRKTKT